MIESQRNGFLFCLTGSDGRHHVHLLLHIIGHGVIERGDTFHIRTRYGQALCVGGVRIPGIKVQRLDTGPVEFLFGIPIVSTVLRVALRSRHAIHEVGRAHKTRISRYGKGLHDAVFRLVVLGYLRTPCHYPVVTGKSVRHFGS